MDVMIVNKSTNRVVAKYAIRMQSLNYRPSEQEYFTEAWECAVEDGIVDAEHRDEYSFQYERNNNGE